MTSVPTVAVAIDFLTAQAKLPRNIQKKVNDFLFKFRANPLSSGINLEKLKNVFDKKIYSVRIDDAYRGIVARDDKSKTFILLWVDRHDEAYEWAARRRCEVNPTTGILQVYLVPSDGGTSAPVANESRLFDAASDDDLLELGVPREQLAFIRSLPNKEAFIDAEDSIPKDAFEYLSWLTVDIPINEVLDLAKEDREAGKVPRATSISEALTSPASQKSFAVVEGEDELREILGAPLEKWRVFLHSTQRKIINKEYSGPAKVLGGAGTGKTVVAMHRAKRLAAEASDSERILFTTFTANLAADIKENLRKICSREELRKIEVVNLDAWINNYLRESGYSAKIEYDRIPDLWKNAVEIAQVDLPYDPVFYEEEWNRVVVPQEALSFEKYATASRKGRGTPLNRQKKILVWKVLDAYYNLMKENKIRDINTAMYECRKLLEKDVSRSRYASVVVDEGQDFGDAAFRLLRALAGEEHENDLFIVGDAHQRIYRNRPTLSKCGINVRGRSSVLKINYRTTEEIRRYAFALLNGLHIDDLDEGVDLGDKCQSLTHGETPEIRNFKNANAEFAFLKEEIRKLQESGVALSSIFVVARTKSLVKDYARLFKEAGINSYEIKRNKADDRSADGLRVATMHRVKGLEFQYVFAAAVNNKVIPNPEALDKTDKVSEAESIASEKCLLYVALTRAQKGAYITSYGKKSEFIQ